MLEENMLFAAARLRAIGKIPNLSVCFPSEKLNNGDSLFKCKSSTVTDDGKTYQIAFDVVIKQNDLLLTTQQVDFDAKIENLPFDQLDLSKSRISFRFAYRIWMSYKSIVSAIHKYAEEKLGL